MAPYHPGWVVAVLDIGARSWSYTVVSVVAMRFGIGLPCVREPCKGRGIRAFLDRTGEECRTQLVIQPSVRVN